MSWFNLTISVTCGRLGYLIADRETASKRMQNSQAVVLGGGGGGTSESK